MRPARTDPVSIVEAAYSLEGDDFEWLTAISAAVAPVIDGGDGVFSYFYDTSESPIAWLASRIELRLSASSREMLELTRRVFGKAPAQDVNRIHTASPLFTTLSTFAGAEPEADGFMPLLRSKGFCDSLALRTSDGSGRGLVVNSTRRDAVSIDSRTRRLWTQVSTHLAAGLRLRRAAMRGIVANEAVLRPDGRVEDATGQAQPKAARELLRDAVLRQEKARGRRRRDDPEGALELWRGLECGRWSLVDQFERGGRRYVMARKNAVEFADPRALTQRERQVVNLAALGHANKLIAYELGLSTSTVANQLASALKKLGLKSRLDLIRWRR